MIKSRISVMLMSMLLLGFFMVGCGGEEKKGDDKGPESGQTDGKGTDADPKPEAGGAFKVDGKASKIMWTGEKGDDKHSGEVIVSGGIIELDGDGNLVAGSFEIDMTSLTNTDLSGGMQEKIEGHLKSGDFFDVANFGTATFKTASVAAGEAPGMWKVTGPVTVKGQSQDISFDVKVEDSGTTAKATANVTLASEKFGLGGDPITISMTVDVNATK